jgi:uncharacterized OsmC-like protein
MQLKKYKTMGTKIVNIKGYAKNGEQFVIKTENQEVRIGTNQNHPELNAPSPIEYVLAGYAGCINAVGMLVAKELNINLKSLKVEISGEINVDKFLGNPTLERAGFKTIEVIVKPKAEATSEELQNWLSVVENRCPVYDNLFNNTPIRVSLVNELETA